MTQIARGAVADQGQRRASFQQARSHATKQALVLRFGAVAYPDDPVAGPGGEIFRYTLESDTKNLQQLSEL